MLSTENSPMHVSLAGERITLSPAVAAKVRAIAASRPDMPAEQVAQALFALSSDMCRHMQAGGRIVVQDAPHKLTIDLSNISHPSRRQWLGSLDDRYDAIRNGDCVTLREEGPTYMLNPRYSVKIPVGTWIKNLFWKIARLDFEWPRNKVDFERWSAPKA